MYDTRMPQSCHWCGRLQCVVRRFSSAQRFTYDDQLLKNPIAARFTELIFDHSTVKPLKMCLKGNRMTSAGEVPQLDTKAVKSLISLSDLSDVLIIDADLNHVFIRGLASPNPCFEKKSTAMWLVDDESIRIWTAHNAFVFSWKAY